MPLALFQAFFNLDFHLPSKHLKPIQMSKKMSDIIQALENSLFFVIIWGHNLARTGVYENIVINNFKAILGLPTSYA